MYTESLPKAAQIKEKKPTTTTVEYSPAQIINQPPKQKHTRRRRLKSHHSRRRRPARTTDSPALKLQGRSCSVQAAVFKRIPPQSQEWRLKTCYCGLKTTSVPSKTADSGQSKSSGVTAGARKGEMEHSEKPKAFSSTRENQRRPKKPSPVEKRQYQAVSEYQFIYPGRAVFHCTKESVKQQLRSIYAGNAGRKSLKPTHPSVEIPHCHWKTNKAQRQNLNADAKCPVGSEFLRSINPNTLPYGLTSLTYKINKLVLVNENRPVLPENPSSSPAVNQCPPPQQQQPAPTKTNHPAEAFQRPSNCTARKGGKEEKSVDQEGRPNQPRQGAARNTLTMSPACSRNSLRPRPASAKDHYRETPKKEDATKGLPGLSVSSKAAVTQTRSAIVIPTISQCSSSESVNAEALHFACSNTAPFLAKAKQQYITFCQPALREKLDGTLAHHSCKEKEQADPFAIPESRRHDPSNMDTW